MVRDDQCADLAESLIGKPKVVRLSRLNGSDDI